MVIKMDFLKKFGINIKNQELLLQALTHSSYSNEHNVKNYERLEFLGDAVLQILMSDYLYSNMDLSEGEMSKTRAAYVCEGACARYAEVINYKPYIRLESIKFVPSEFFCYSNCCKEGYEELSQDNINIIKNIYK